MKEVNIYIKDSCDAFTKNGYYDALLTTHGKELRFSKSFSNTSHYRLIIQGAIDAIEKLNQSCIINLYTTSPFGMRRIRHGDGTWRTELGHSVNMDLLLELKRLIEEKEHTLNTIYDNEVVEIILCTQNNHTIINSMGTNSQFNVTPNSFCHNQQQHDIKDDCIFCNLSSDLEIICETSTCVAFYDADPVSPGHTLIIPKRHVESYFDLSKKEQEAMNAILLLVKEKIDKRFHPDGYNIGINVNESAGQSIFHVHMHVIPRYKGDVNNPKGGIRGVIPSRQGYGDDTHIVYNSTQSQAKTKEHEKAYTIEQKREEHGNAYLPWDDEADALLIRMYEEEGKSVKLLAEIFERAPGAIRSRLKKLGKIK